MRRLSTFFAPLLLLGLSGLAFGDPPRGLSAQAHGWPHAGEKVAVLVHGINPIHADLDPLEGDLVRRGFRVLRFVYDDRAHLDQSAGKLAKALRDLCTATRPSRVAIVAHSMGGLVSRRALTTAHGLQALPTRFRLVTIASPFGGFRSANWARFDFGIGPRVFDTLGSRSSFIRNPGQLIPRADHVKVETNEANKRLNGEDDDKVKLKSQTQPTIDAAVHRRHRLVLGHVGSIRDEHRRVPAQTITLLSVYVGTHTTPLRRGCATDPRQARATSSNTNSAPARANEAREGARHRLRVGPRHRR